MVLSENIERLRSFYGDYYHVSLAALPDSAVAHGDQFLLALKGIGALVPAVLVRFGSTGRGGVAYCTPKMPVWTPASAMQLGEAQLGLLRDTESDNAG